MNGEDKIFNLIAECGKKFAEHQQKIDQHNARLEAERAQKLAAWKRNVLTIAGNIVGAEYAPYLIVETAFPGTFVEVVLELPGCTKINFELIIAEDEKSGRVSRGFNAVSFFTVDGEYVEWIRMESFQDIELAIGMSRHKFVEIEKIIADNRAKAEAEKRKKADKATAKQEQAAPKELKPVHYTDGRFHFVRTAAGEFVFPVLATVISSIENNGIIQFSCNGHVAYLEAGTSVEATYYRLEESNS